MLWVNQMVDGTTDRPTMGSLCTVYMMLVETASPRASVIVTVMFFVPEAVGVQVMIAVVPEQPEGRPLHENE